MPELKKGQIAKANKKYWGRFAPKYRAFGILQNKIKDVVKKSIQMCKLIYGLNIVTQREEDPFKGKNDSKDEMKNKIVSKKEI